MTIDDLERDLKDLATPQATDERLRLAIRAQLVERLEPRPKRRLVVRFAFGLAAVAAAVVAAIAVLAGTNGSGGPTAADAAIIHHALRAVSPPANSILHVKTVAIQNGTTVVGEWWQETSPPYASRGAKGPVGNQGESADNGTTTFEYDPATNTIHEQPDTAAPTFQDPVAGVRQALNSGQAHVEGTVVIDGESLYKIELKHGVVGYFDQSTYAPRYLDDPQGPGGGALRFRVSYEYLPLTAANARLLSITAEHPTARIDTNPNDAPGK
jgi:hypothetical protein